ncbi:MAG: carboxypeptidase-like regulatory domain-containing protein [Balneola sp.]|nr:MAG: carboxypeptidase-like regulatory domain-containing protein [Balneola sp.]
MLNSCKIFLLFLIVIIACDVVNAQSNVLRGKILDSDTGESLPGTHIFINKTTIGTISDKDGNYALPGIPNGEQTIVFSFIGFKEHAVKIEFPVDENQTFNVSLKPKDFELGQIQVRASNKEWKRNLELFKKHFFGYTNNSSKMEILNPEVLDFENSGSELIANGEAPLKILNKALGYEITYYLNESVSSNDSFNASFYVKFEEMKADSEQEHQAWLRERKRSYEGSFVHFLNALDNNSYEEEGFEIFAAKKESLNNFEGHHDYSDKAFTKEIIKQEFSTFPKNSKWIELFVPKKYDYIKVVYINEEIGYLLKSKIRMSGNYDQISWIEIPNQTAVVNKFIGSYSEPGKYTLHGFWGWTHRIPELLPDNYNIR